MKDTSQMDYDVVVLGGGLAGLTLGALLSAGSSLRIAVLEKEKQVGGKASVTIVDGIPLDNGVHGLLLGNKSSAIAVAKSLGEKIMVQPAGITFLEDGKMRRLIGTSLPSVLRSKKLGAKSFIEIVRMARGTVGQGRDSLYTEPLSRFMTSKGFNQDVKDVLKSFSIGLVASKDYEQVSTGEILDYILLSAQNMSTVGYFKNGWNGYFSILENAISIGKSSKLLTGCKVEKIRCETAGYLVSTDSGDIAAKALVLAFPPDILLMDEIIEEVEFPRELIKYARELKPSRGLAIDLILNGRPVGSQDVLFTIDPPSVAMATSELAPGMVPKGNQVFYIFSPTTDENDLKKGLPERLLSVYEKYFPGLTESIQFKRANMIDVCGAFPGITRSYIDRPKIVLDSERLLFAVGDWVQSRGLGGEMAMRSATIASKEILSRFSV